MDETTPVGVIPRPQWHRFDGHGACWGDLVSYVSLAADGEAWQRLADLSPNDLPPEGYGLRIEQGDAGSSRDSTTDSTTQVWIAAADEAGLRHANATLGQLSRRNPNGLPRVSIRDWPQLPWRGTIEGFYGPPWSHEARLDHLRFAASVKLNSYVYAPKDDRYHRARWRDLYPEAELAELGELVAAASALGVRFTYALAPGLSMRYSDDAEHQLLVRKAEQLWNAGVRSFALLFDDVPVDFTHDEDRAAYGSEPGSTGTAHGEVTTRFQRDFLQPHGSTEQLVVVPTDYAGMEASPYRANFARTLPADVLVWWTGSDIVVGEITRDEIDLAAGSYQRDLLLWDNFPVNDFDSARLFLGPLTGRTRDLSGSALRGISINPMVEASASKFGIASAADWAWNPAGYDEQASADAALWLIAATDAAALLPLVAVNSSWPPSASQSVELDGLIARALGEPTEPSAVGALRGRFEALTRLPEHLATERKLLELDLVPWIAAARDAGTAGVLACDVLERGSGATSSVTSAERDALSAALDAAESHTANVLRSIVPPFVREVLARTGA